MDINSEKLASYNRLKDPVAYTLTHLSTGKVYIGSTSNWKDRLYRHRTRLSQGKHGNLELQEAYKKDNRIDVFIWIFSNREEAYDHEQSYLDEHFKKDKLFNRSSNARNSAIGRIIRPETKLKISIANKGRKFDSEIGRKRGLKLRGQKRTEIQCKRISLALKGRKPTKETIAKITAKTRGLKRTAEFCEKISLVHKGKAKQKHIADRLKKHNEIKSKKVMLNGIIYPSQNAAAAAIGRSVGYVVQHNEYKKEITK